MKKVRVRWGRVFSLITVVGLTVALALRITDVVFVEDLSNADATQETYELQTDIPKVQYYQGATLKKLNTDAVIKIKDDNKQESELKLDGIAYLYSSHASTYIAQLLEDNNFVVQYSTKTTGQIYINDQSLTNLLIEKGYTNIPK